jgi:hypothetical protein
MDKTKGVSNPEALKRFGQAHVKHAVWHFLSCKIGHEINCRLAD